MAEAMALTSITKSAFELFTSLAKEELLLLWKSGKELKRLKSTIDTINSFLQDAEERRFKDGSVQKCLSNLRNVMYDAEDLFDTLAASALHKRTIANNVFTKEVRLFFSKSNQLSFMFKAAHQVKSLRESLDAIKEDMEGFSFIKQQPLVDQSIIRVNRKKTHHFVHEEDVIGRDQDRDHIIDMLLTRDNGDTSHALTFSVVALIGFGGLGKTTLAQLVYNDKRVEQGFDVCLWACINDLSNLEQVLIEVLASREGRHNDLGLVMLQKKLLEIIGGRKFLIVLDDVWDKSSRNWGQLETILRCGKSGSKVLVTTRSIEVAKCLNALEPYCDLGVLSDESAWSLFVKKAFDHNQELSKHPELESIGKKIVHRCGKVPLAIIIVGSLLRHKKREERIWSEFLENRLREVLSNSDGDNVKQVLMVSYNDLPPNLKLCFAYCSLFPKDYTFNKGEIVRLWLSQGFIKPCVNNEQSLEELGEACFFRLVERCFFQEVKEYKRFAYDGHGSYYDPCGLTAKMHDLLHDVAIHVANTQSVFLHKAPASEGQRITSLRHLSIGYEVGDSSKPCSDLVSDPKTLRSLLLFHRRKQLSKSFLDQLLERFRMLRSLSLSHLRIDVISDCIGEMIHLKYLNLSYNEELKRLPSSICKLHQLMIFVLEGCKLLEKLPLEIGNLVSLRQLYINGCDRLDSLPPSLRHMTQLVHLDRLIVHHQSGGLRYLNNLDNLSGILSIELPEEGWLDAFKDASKSNMSKKTKLNGITVEWKRNHVSRHPQISNKDSAKSVLEVLRPHESLEYLKISNYSSETLPSWVCMLKNLRELCLTECDVEYLEDEVRGDVCFPSLKILIVEDMKNLKGWWREETPADIERTRLPKVSHVTICNCPELKGQMPLIEEIEYLNLSDVDVKLVIQLLPLNSHGNNNKLQELHLCCIEGLESMPEGQIRHLTTLKKLEIDSCRDLKRVSCRGLANLTAIKELRLGSFKINDEDDEKTRKEVGMPWKALIGLDSLQVTVVDNHFLEGLQYLTSLKELEIGEWMHIEGDAGEYVELPSKSLQSLHKLTVGFGDNTIHLLKVGIQNLPSLKCLRIKRCKELYLSWKIFLCMKLEELEFKSVESVMEVEEAMLVEQQSQLRHLKIYNGGNWISDLPWKSLGSLVWLTLTGIGENEHLPDGIQCLNSLRDLWIDRCEKVRSLPKWIAQHQLPSLRRLALWDCSEELKRRCEKEMGEDWHLICHLDHVHITSRDDFRRRISPTQSFNESEVKQPTKRGWCCQFKTLKQHKKDMKLKKGSLLLIKDDKPLPQPPPPPSLPPPPPQQQQPSHTNLEPVVVLDNPTMIAKPTSLANSEPQTSQNISELIPNPKPTLVASVNTNHSSLQPLFASVQKSFTTLEYMPGFESGDIHFTYADIAELVNRWNLSLVGAPIGATISYHAMQQFVSTHWTENIIFPEILLHDNGLFVFHFDNEEHLLSILQKGPWMISDKIPLILRRWNSGMPLDMSCFEQVIVWVTLPNLDVRFWSHNMLSRIGSAIGCPILTDYDLVCRERIKFPRLLVQVSAKQQLLDEVRFHGADGEIVCQRLQYEWLPLHCPKCCVFGHRCIDPVTEVQLELT